MMVRLACLTYLVCWTGWYPSSEPDTLCMMTFRTRIPKAAPTRSKARIPQSNRVPDFKLRPLLLPAGYKWRKRPSVTAELLLDKMLASCSDGTSTECRDTCWVRRLANMANALTQTQTGRQLAEQTQCAAAQCIHSSK